MPTIQGVEDAWLDVILNAEREEKSLLLHLTINEKKVIEAISNGYNEKMSSALIVNKVGIAQSTMAKTLKALIKKDVIDKEREKYFVINPVISAMAKR